MNATQAAKIAKEAQAAADIGFGYATFLGCYHALCGTEQTLRAAVKCWAGKKNVSADQKARALEVFGDYRYN